MRMPSRYYDGRVTDGHTHTCTALSLQAEGKYRQQGKNYTVEDGDIIYFKVNAGAGLSASKK